MDIVYSLLYFVGSIYIAISCGLFFIFALKNFSIPKISKFLIGVSFYPYLIGIYMTLITIPFKNFPTLFYIMIPYIISSIIILIFSKKIKSYIFELINMVKKDGTYYESTFVIITCSLFSAFVSYIDSNTLIILIVILLVQILYFLYKKTINWNKEEYKCNTVCITIILLSFRNRFAKIDNFTIIALCIEVLLICYLFLNKRYKRYISVSTVTIVYINFLFFFIHKICIMKSIAIEIMMATMLITFLYIFYLYNIFETNTLKNIARIFINKEKIIFIIFIAELFSFIMCYGITPIVGSDAIQYFSEAYEYATKLNFNKIICFTGNSEGTLLSDIHSPVWSSYISNALLYSKNIGFPHDYAARIAISISYILMLVSIIALCYSLKMEKYRSIIITIIMSYTYYYSLITSQSRDGFRIIPLLALLVLMIYKPKKSSFLDLIIYLIICILVMIGHPINAISAIIFVISCLLWEIVNRKFNMKETIKIYLFSVLGALIGGIQIVIAYISTKSFTGGLIDFENVLYNTSYYYTYINSMNETMGLNLNNFEKMISVLFNDNGIISILMIISFAYLLIVSIKNKEYKNIEFLFVICIAINFILVTDVFKWSGSSYLQWCYRNFRYTIQNYIIYALVICLFINRIGNNKKLFNSIILVYFGFAMLLTSYRTVYNVGINYSNDINTISDVNSIAEEIYPNKILLDNYNTNYYLKNKGLCFWTKPMDKIRKANNNNDLYSELKNKNIKVILLTNQYIDLYWKNTQIEKFINSNYIGNMKTIIDTNNNVKYVLYFIKDINE